MRRLSKHTDAINVLKDERDRTVVDILYLQKCIGNIEEHLKHGAPFPAMHEYQTVRLRRKVKEQTHYAKKLTAAIKTLEEDN